jgi:anti-sigma regulatory factor (Ser/Thr protein kinase)
MGIAAPPPCEGEEGTPPAPLLLSLRCEATPGAVTRARHALRQAVTAEGLGSDLADTLELLLAELMTNAVLHTSATGRIAVAVLHRGGSVRIAVIDAAPGDLDLVRLTAGEPHPLDEHGRGLLLVQAMAEEWGSYSVPDGKVVWCDVKP